MSIGVFGNFIENVRQYSNSKLGTTEKRRIV